MEFSAVYKYVRLSSQKARLVANLIRNETVTNAMKILSFTNKKSSFYIKKLLQSAISNAKNNNSVDIVDLKIKKIFVDVGPTMKRIMPRAKGKSDRILKRTSHITIILSN